MDSAITELGMTRRFRRVREAVPAARAFVQRWLPDSGPTEGLVLAAAEAINNVIDHAAGDGFTVAVDLDRTVGRVTVVDAGPGFDVPLDPGMPEPLESSCRGIAMMHALSDDVAIVSSRAGTSVTLRQEFPVVGDRPDVPFGSAVA
jgi:anti-sigma regulatory factor (Ser/Thr protein kinase)